MKTKKMAISAMFIAVGVLAGNIIYIPVGASKCFPVQHTLNILAAVFLGPAYGVINAFCISLLRNFMGTGSLLAFPGSMVGAFLAGMIYKMTKNNWATAVAEVVGTGVLGGLLAVPIAILMMGQEAGALAFGAFFPAQLLRRQCHCHDFAEVCPFCAGGKKEYLKTGGMKYETCIDHSWF